MQEWEVSLDAALESGTKKPRSETSIEEPPASRVNASISSPLLATKLKNASGKLPFMKRNASSQNKLASNTGEAHRETQKNHKDWRSKQRKSFLSSKSSMSGLCVSKISSDSLLLNFTRLEFKPMSCKAKTK